MTPSLPQAGRQPRSRQGGASGQALIEFVFITLMLIVLLFGLIDFGRAIYERQVLVNLSREGSNLASRGATLSNTVAAIIASANPLDLNAKGRVIVTAVVNTNGAFLITGQLSGGGFSAASQIGTGVGGVASLPVTNPVIPPPNQTLFVTEVYYSFTPVTPVGRLLRVVMPTRLYDVAYF